MFAEASENEENVAKPEEPVVTDKATEVQASETEKDSTVKVAEEAPKPVDAVELSEGEKKEGDKTDKNDAEDIDRPGFFGFRLPTIVILRRPAIFDDPFSFFPFSIPSVNRRPGFGEPLPPQNSRDGEEEPLPISSSAAASPSEQRPVSVGGNNAGIGGKKTKHATLSN